MEVKIGTIFLAYSCIVYCSWLMIQIHSTHRSTLSMASGSGGGIWKQTPGKVFVTPSGQVMFQFSLSEFDFRVNFSPLDKDTCTVMINTTSKETAVCMNKNI